MHDIAAAHCANVDDSNTVITIPLSYAVDRREAVRACAEKAGFRVVQVISEPVAACLAHGLEQEMVSIQRLKKCSEIAIVPYLFNNWPFNILYSTP